MRNDHHTQNVASLIGSAAVIALLIILAYHFPDALIALAHKPLDVAFEKLSSSEVHIQS